MMSAVHAMFSKELYEHIYLKCGIKLKKNSLIFGSIEPDATTLFAKHPHYIDKSLDMLCERIEALYDVSKVKQNLNTKSFARELGVATHYIADFFCRVHNDINGIKHDEHISHVVYEQKMNMKVSEVYLDVIRENFIDSIDDEVEKVKTYGIKKYILDNHCKYMQEAGTKLVCLNKKKQYAVDVKYAMDMILAIGTSIIQNK